MAGSSVTGQAGTDSWALCARVQEVATFFLPFFLSASRIPSGSGEKDLYLGKYPWQTILVRLFAAKVEGLGEDC